MSCQHNGTGGCGNSNHGDDGGAIAPQRAPRLSYKKRQQEQQNEHQEKQPFIGRKGHPVTR